MQNENKTSEPPDPRLVEANIGQAEAAARKAAAEAAAAERAEAEASSEVARRQRDAEARKATAEADKTAREAEISADPTLLRQQKEAEAKKAVAEANKAASDAQQAQIGALIPDFSKVQVPAMKIEGDQAVRGHDLGRHALRGAASRVAEAIGSAAPKADGGKALVLLTADPDLATADGAFIEVDAGLKRLTDSADELLPADDAGFAIAPLIAAGASALPGLISMLAPRQTLSSRAIADDDTAAVASVAGALVSKGCDVRIDDFRLVPADGLRAREGELRDRRDRLAKYKLEQDRVKIDQDTIRSAAAERAADLLKVKDDSLDGNLPPTLDDNIAQARSERDQAATNASRASVTAEMVGTLITAIDAFFVTIHAVPAGGTRTPFVCAALHEGLRSTTEGRRFDAIVYIKGSGGSVDQRIEELFLRKDRIEAMASVSVSYWMITPGSSNVVASGVVTGTSRLSGKIGGSLTITEVPSS